MSRPDYYTMLRRYYPQLPELPDPSAVDDNWRPEDPDAFFGPIADLNAWGKIRPTAFRGTLLRIHKRLQYEKKRAGQRAEDDRRAALRGPPVNCRREDNTLYWDPPDLEDGEAPECYWVSEERNGEWTQLQPPIYPGEALQRHLYGNGPGRVSAYYPNEPQRLGWGYRHGPVLKRPAETPERMARIVEAVRTYTGPCLIVSGAPYLVYLRRHAKMPGISSAERHEAFRQVEAEAKAAAAARIVEPVGK